MQLWRQFLNWGQTPAGVQQDWCWHVRFDAWLFKLSDALMPAFDAGHPLLAHAGSVQVAVFSHPTSISNITPTSQITLSPHFNITFVPYTQYWRDKGTATCLALRGAMWRLNQCTVLLSITVGDIKSYRVLLSPSGDLGIGLVWDNHPDRTGPIFWSDCWNPLQTELNYLGGVLSCS